MVKYTAKECSCWSEYPNEACKKNNGQWKCVDCYELVKEGDNRTKTRCKLKEVKQMIDKDVLFDSLCSIIHYNGLDDFLNYLMATISGNNVDKLTVDYVKEFYYLIHPDDDLWIFSTYDYGQLEIIWMFFVLMFGDYGTSPRSGWIDKDNFDDLREFIDMIFDEL